MRPTPNPSPRISAAESGFSLIELVLTVTLLMFVMGSLLTIFESVQRSAAFTENRSETLDSMRLSLDQMTKEIRQATAVSPNSTSSRLEMDTYILGVTKQVVYEASGTELTRSVNDGTPVVLQDHVTSTDVFTYTDSVFSVQVVGLTLSVHPTLAPDTTLVLTSEASLRNRSSV
jgi:type II secretory pathway pseudopilin PulG